MENEGCIAWCVAIVLLAAGLFGLSAVLAWCVSAIWGAPFWPALVLIALVITGIRWMGSLFN